MHAYTYSPLLVGIEYGLIILMAASVFAQGVLVVGKRPRERGVAGTIVAVSLSTPVLHAFAYLLLRRGPPTPLYRVFFSPIGFLPFLVGAALALTVGLWPALRRRLGWGVWIVLVVVICLGGLQCLLDAAIIGDETCCGG